MVACHFGPLGLAEPIQTTGGLLGVKGAQALLERAVGNVGCMVLCMQGSGFEEAWLCSPCAMRLSPDLADVVPPRTQPHEPLSKLFV